MISGGSVNKSNNDNPARRDVELHQDMPVARARAAGPQGSDSTTLASVDEMLTVAQGQAAAKKIGQSFAPTRYAAIGLGRFGNKSSGAQLLEVRPFHGNDQLGKRLNGYEFVVKMRDGSTRRVFRGSRDDGNSSPLVFGYWDGSRKRMISYDAPYSEYNTDPSNQIALATYAGNRILTSHKKSIVGQLVRMARGSTKPGGLAVRIGNVLYPVRLERSATPANWSSKQRDIIVTTTINGTKFRFAINGQTDGYAEHLTIGTLIGIPPTSAPSQADDAIADNW